MVRCVSMFFLFLAAIAYAQPVPVNGEAPSAAGVPLYEPFAGEPPSASATTTVMLKYHDVRLPHFNWQMPNNYGSFINLFMLQRFTLPNDAGFLDSIQVYIRDISTGAISFRVYPAEILDVGTSSFYFPKFTPAIDSLFIDKSRLKMDAWNSIKFNGAVVPKEFFISTEFTISGGTNNTIVIPGDFHELPGRTLDRTRVIMLNSVAGQLQMRTLDSTLVESGTQKPIYSYLYMTAFVDTATSNAVPKIVTTPVTTGYVGLPYKYDLHAASNPRSVYKLIEGPPGLYVEWYTGEVKWNPTENDLGQHTVTIEAFNPNGADRQTWTLTIVRPTEPKITSFPRKTAIVGEPYFYQVTATGGPPPVFSLQASVSGLTIDPVSGLLQMTPTAGQVGIHLVGVVATNAVGRDVQSFSLRIDATASPPLITSNPKTTATLNEAYSYRVDATGNPQPTFSLLISPQGMTIDNISGQINWTPTQTGDFDVKVRAENRAGSDDQSFTVHVEPAAVAPVITFTPRVRAVAGQPFVDTVTATGKPAPKFFLTTAPAGMSIDSLTGIITWTPSRDQSGYNSVIVQARNTVGTAEYPYSINVLTSPRITSTEIFTARVGQEYRYQAAAEGNPEPTWSLTTAPQGMTVGATTGLVTWTPTQQQVGRHSVVLVAMNEVGSAQQRFTVDVLDPAPVENPPERASALADVFPNPVAPGSAEGGMVTCTFQAAAFSRVVIELRDVIGRVTASLLDATVEPGRHAVVFDARSFAPGIYILVLRSGDAVHTRRLVVLR
ncbi:MAG: putative Ig domain-containing protein [Bacteroidota bacterium]|nr:putative Ig domain-containing protein [Bacteroidota bacterium]